MSQSGTDDVVRGVSPKVRSEFSPKQNDQEMLTDTKVEDKVVEDNSNCFVNSSTKKSDSGIEKRKEAPALLNEDVFDKPKYPLFSSKAARVESFEGWPPMRQKPEDLAEAGFFYTGEGDRTLCFYCAGGLKDWEDSDDPWEQHARWFNECGYLHLNRKGKQTNVTEVKK